MVASPRWPGQPLCSHVLLNLQRIKFVWWKVAFALPVGVASAPLARQPFGENLCVDGELALDSPGLINCVPCPVCSWKWLSPVCTSYGVEREANQKRLTPPPTQSPWSCDLGGLRSAVLCSSAQTLSRTDFTRLAEGKKIRRACLIQIGFVLQTIRALKIEVMKYLLAVFFDPAGC